MSLWIRIVLYVTVLATFGVFVGSGRLLDDGALLERASQVSLLACALAAAGALAYLCFGGAPLPLRLRLRVRGPYLSVNPSLAWVFEFDDAAAARQFADASRE